MRIRIIIQWRNSVLVAPQRSRRSGECQGTVGASGSRALGSRFSFEIVRAARRVSWGDVEGVGDHVSGNCGTGFLGVNSRALFFDKERHGEALALLASAYLSKGDPASAFPFADRRCRVQLATARDYLLRAEASRLTGHSDYAESDLESALEIDPTDPLVNFGALSWGSKDARSEAAKRLVRDVNASAEVLAKAVEVLMGEGARVVHTLRRVGRKVEGWVCWIGSHPLEMRPHGSAGGAEFSIAPNLNHPLTRPGVSAAHVAVRDDGATPRAWELMLDGEISARVSSPLGPGSASLMGAPAYAVAFSAASVNVIVPVYEDFEATRACLEGLVQQKCVISRRVVVVDDQSPNAELRIYLDRAAARRDIELIRNETNLGFAGAVNRALASCDSGDVLLVNADAWLPAGAIDRLAAVAHGAADIGTVTPFSNNGELTSYPKAHVANPLPTSEAIIELDALAQRANGGSVVDLPNGIGFCLYIKRACLDAVGPLSEAYLQGYYEDVEFCLKAHEHGFRNVGATGIFVGHAGSRSFGIQKRPLVVRNLGVMELRFPHYRASCAAFLAADPMKSARAAMDALSAFEGEVIWLAHGRGKSKQLAEMRAKQIVDGDPGAIVVLCGADLRGDRVDFRREGEGAPQSLSFSLASPDGPSVLREYLSRPNTCRVEVFDAPSLPESLLESLFALEARIELICADLEWFGRLPQPYGGSCRGKATRETCDSCEAIFLPKATDSEEGVQLRNRLSLALTHADAIKPLDRMGDAFSRRIFKAKAVSLDESPAPAALTRTGLDVEVRTLGVLAPVPSAMTDRLVLRLGRLLAREGRATKIVVVGRCIDDLALMATGNVFVTGPAAPDEYERLVAQFDIGALLSADRTAFFGLLDRLALATGAPKAYFDWSFGALERQERDLSIDPRICDEKAIDAIASWLRPYYRNGTE